MRQIKTILHPTDFSKAADQALQVAHALARDHNSKLVLATVAAPPPPIDVHYPDLPYSAPTGPAEILEEARQLLAASASSIVDVPVETHAVLGAPGVSIVAAAQDLNADLIVMGTHGRTGVSRLLLGSVAEFVMRHAACPVLTIKPGTSQHLSRQEETALASPRPTGLTKP